MENESCEPRDRLSELPDSLLFDIFWLVPMRDVVRTTTLSKRWRNLWTTTPSLNFEEAEIDTDRARRFINGALMFWRGTRVQKFKIEFSNVTTDIYRDIEWVCFAKKSKVEDLIVYLRYKYDTYPLDAMYRLPDCLYSCSSLVNLDIEFCNLRIPTNNVSWDRLYSLRIYGYEVSQDWINKVLRGSPKLEDLILKFTENHDSLCIEHGSLIYLYVEKYYLYYEDEDPSTDKELRIWTPRFETLEISGVPYARCSMKVPSLTMALLSFYGPTYYRYGLFSKEDSVGETLKQLLSAIQHVEVLILSDRCIKALVAMRKKNILSPFPNVYYLVLKGSFEEYEEMVHLLEIFPELEMLVLKQEKANNKQVGNAKASLKFEAKLPDSFLQRLWSISIDWTEGEGSVFPLIQMLLKHANKLEKMVVTVKETADSSNSLTLALQKILKMPKSSPTAVIILR